MQHHVAEVLKPRVVGMIHVCNLGCRNRGRGRAGVVNELVRLMRADVAKDAAVLGRVPKPIGTAGGVQLMGRDVDGLHNFADCAVLDQVACLHGRAHL